MYIEVTLTICKPLIACSMYHDQFDLHWKWYKHLFPTHRSCGFAIYTIYPRLGWLDHQRPRVIDRPVPELVVQLLETQIAWRQPKQSETNKQFVYFIEVQQPKNWDFSHFSTAMWRDRLYLTNDIMHDPDITNQCIDANIKLFPCSRKRVDELSFFHHVLCVHQRDDFATLRYGDNASHLHH